MSKRKINLEEILDKVRCIDGNPDNGQLYDDDLAKAAMLEFGKQLLELAAENAKTKEYISQVFAPTRIIVNKQSILDTIKQIE
jgi:hypothetical protein